LAKKELRAINPTEMLAKGAEARQRVIEEIIPALVGQFGEAVTVLELTADAMPQIALRPEALKVVALWLKEQGFNMLVDIGGVDYYSMKRNPRFEVVYHFRQFPALGMLRVRVRVNDGESVPTLSDIWTMANPAEREIWDQFGIKFAGHPNLTRILNPDDWEGHPLRRDYPLRGPRGLINLEMPADENKYRSFVDVRKEEK
jgi:NADH-quinone oxidoreductase subunit C